MHNMVSIHIQVPPPMRSLVSTQGSGYWKLRENMHVLWRKEEELSLEKGERSKEGGELYIRLLRRTTTRKKEGVRVGR